MLGLTSWWAEEGRRLPNEGKRLCEFSVDDDDDDDDVLIKEVLLE